MPSLLCLLLLVACSPSSVDRHEPPGHPGTQDSEGETDTDTDTDTETDTDTDTGEPQGLQEMRGVWITRWTFSSAEDVEEIFSEIEQAGFNAAFFQIRGTFDAFYASSLEPWAKDLTGTLGKDPGWDPLAEAVKAGKRHGIQVHAYMNLFPLWSTTSTPAESTPRHALLDHPDWKVVDEDGDHSAAGDSYIFSSPGNAQVREWVAQVARDIASNYDVDGIHLDYVRYPGSGFSHDDASEAAWQGSTSSWADWERQQVVEAVRGVYGAVHVPVTAAVWGIYINKWESTWGSTSEGYSDYYQDAGAFLSEGVLDANIPMIYWGVTDTPGERLDFATLALDHVSRAHGRHVYTGIDASLGEEEVLKCIDAARSAGAQGVVLFDYSTARGDGWMEDLRTSAFAEPARVPSMSWR